MIAIRRGVVFPFGCRYDAIIGRSKTRTRIAAARISAAARREATAATFIADLSSHASVRRLATEVLARYPMSIRCERRRNSSILFRHAFVLLMALTACSFCVVGQCPTCADHRFSGPGDAFPPPALRKKKRVAL
jgi:hypothetical protein